MKKYVDLLRNTGLFAISNVATKFIQMFFLPLYTAYLTTSDYAIADMAFVIQSLFWPILSLSLTDALLRFAMDDEYDIKKIFTICSVLITPGFIVCFLIFFFINIDDTLFLYKHYLFIYYIAVSVNSFFSVFARTIEKIKLVVINSILSSLLITIFSIIFLLLFNLGIVGYFYSLILGNLIVLISYVYFGKFTSFLDKKFWDVIIIKELLKYSVPLIPNAVFWWVNSSLDKFCLMTLIGLSGTGLYSVAGKISSSLNIITTIFSQAWSMSVIKEYKSDDSDAFFSNIYSIYNIVILFMSFGVMIAIKLIARVLFSNEFYAAWKYVPYLIIAFYYNALNVYLGSIFTAYKRTNLIFWTTGAGAVANLFLNIIMIKGMGIQGAAVATILSNMVVYVVRKNWINRYMTITISNTIQWILPIFLMILAVSIVNGLPIYVSGVIFCVSMIMLSYEIVIKVLIPLKVKSIIRHN